MFRNLQVIMPILIFGAIYDETATDSVIITVIATGIEDVMSILQWRSSHLRHGNTGSWTDC